MNWQAAAEVLSEAIAAIREAIDKFKETKDDARLARAADALTVIAAIAESVGDVSKLEPERAREEIARIRAALADDDRAANRALEKKFDNT